MDPDLILTLKAENEVTGQFFSQNKDRYLPPKPVRPQASNLSKVTPVKSDKDDGDENYPRVELRLNGKPKDLRNGFVFGTDPTTCDVVIGDDDSGVSRCHFRINFDEESRLVLSDFSTNGTSISYDESGRSGSVRNNFRWILFDWAKTIHVHIEGSIHFTITLASHRNCEPNYKKFLQRYLAESKNAAALNGQLDSGNETPGVALAGERAQDQKPLYYFNKELGQGGFGVVYLAYDVSTGKQFAAKCFHHKDETENERKMLEAVSHQHIIKFVAFYGFKHDLYGQLLIMEYAPEGNLYDIHKVTPITEAEMYEILIQCLEALRYMHSEMKMAHRDLKPANILVKSRVPMCIKIGDFGTASTLFTNTCVGTLEYASPEMFKPHQQTFKVDLWSLGVVALNFTGGLPLVLGGWDKWQSDIQARARDSAQISKLMQLVRNRMLVKSVESRADANTCLEALQQMMTGNAPRKARQHLVTPQPQNGCVRTGKGNQHRFSPYARPKAKAKSEQERQKRN